MPFVSYDTLLSLLLESNLPIGLDDYSLLSFLLIRTKAGVDVEPLRARLTAALPDADFGIHEVLGATPHQFAAALTAGSLIVAVVAIPAAMLLARVFAEVVARWNPLYSAGVWDPGVLGLALGLASAMVGGLLPLRLDPSLVFQR